MKQFCLYLLIATFGVACQSSSPEKKESNEPEDSVAISVPSLEEPTPKEEIGTIFIGTIDRKYPITVNIVRKEDELSGSYYYDKIGESITIKGEVRGEKTYLEEIGKDGVTTGIWELKTNDLSEWIYGSWTNPKTKKTMDLDLTEVDARIWKNTLESPWNGFWTDGIGTLEFRKLEADTFYFHHFSMNEREHIGEIRGELIIQNNRGLHQNDVYGTGGEDICKISYQKEGDTIVVKQETTNDCGAGQGVYFDGKFVRKAQYDAYWEAKPLAEKIGKGRV
jgi:hypothetical protein